MKVLGLFISVVLGMAVNADEIKIGGSSTVKPIIEKAAKLFKGKHPGVKIIIGGGGSSKGVAGAADGIFDIGMASRELKDTEKAKHPDIKAYTIGRDGLAIVVNSQNTLTDITLDQVKQAYTGQINNWKVIGGADAAIELVGKGLSHGTSDLFLKAAGLEAKVVGEGKARKIFYKDKAGEFTATSAMFTDENKETLAKLIIDRKGKRIAFMSIGTSEAIAAKGGRIKLLALNSVAANKANVINGTYPIIRTLNVVTKGEPSGKAKEFIDFLFSTEGQKIIEGLKFVPVK